MKKNLSLLIAAIIIGGLIPQISCGFENPLKKYDLYADTHKQDSPHDGVLSELYYEQHQKKNNNSSSVNTSKQPPKTVPTTPQGGIEVNVEVPQRRNDYLRESSMKVYSSSSGSWMQGPYFYDAPSLESIKKKYHLSNFAGCLQECEAYVQKHPYDTLGYYYLAMSYAKCGQKENAIAAYEKVISLHDNPMIVKYATNGRNCVMGNEDEAKCFQNVNEPELLYPYRNKAREHSLTPVDPQELINKNLSELQQRINEAGAGQQGDNPTGVQLPFNNQDEKLDKFINAPYGSGFSPELEIEYKQQQLKNIQQEINKEDDNNPGKYFQNIRNIKDFDNSKTESETIKLALADNMDIADILNNPEYIQNKKELDQIKMMFGDYGTENSSTDITTLLPQMAEGGENLSPQVVQMMMMQSIMPNIIDTDSKTSF